MLPGFSSSWYLGTSNSLMAQFIRHFYYELIFGGGGVGGGFWSWEESEESVWDWGYPWLAVGMGLCSFDPTVRLAESMEQACF